MENQDLRKLLVQLHDEIGNTQAVDKKGTELLRDLEADINALLERSGEEPVQLHEGNVLNLEDTLSHFEVTHPDLTALISKILEALSNSGI
jgi:hypothetical protein